MKEYNCPDCSINTDSCIGCHRINNSNKTDLEVDWSKFSIYSTSAIPEACKHCATHPSNGGDGICWCVLGSQKIFY